MMADQKLLTRLPLLINRAAELKKHLKTMVERYGARKYKIEVSYQKVLTKSKWNEDSGWVCVHLIRVGFRTVRFVCGEKLHWL